MLLKVLNVKSYLVLVQVITISISCLTQSSDAKVIPNAYIVQVADTADVHEAARKATRFTGGTIGHVYSKALWGFSIQVPPGITKAQILAQPGVILVEPDLEVAICAQALPTGVNRIDADLSDVAKIDGIDERVDIDIAIIDTGIDIDHPDLYVVGGRRFYTRGVSVREDDTMMITATAATSPALQRPSITVSAWLGLHPAPGFGRSRFSIKTARVPCRASSPGWTG